MRRSATTRSLAYQAGGFALILALGAILAALAFEHIGGYKPCPLCLKERYAYYAGVPLLFAALVLLAARLNSYAEILFWLVALAFVINAGLGVYHAGVEWKFWLGPDTCAAPAATITKGVGSFMSDLAKTRVIRCDEAPWHFMGLSFAGWNAVVSFVVATAAARAALTTHRE
ncbi:MAG: disulfide bond formation protein B [Hyphomicrobiaceae bacterium]